MDFLKQEQRLLLRFGLHTFFGFIAIFSLYHASTVAAQLKFISSSCH